MAVNRMDNVGIVVEDIDAAIELRHSMANRQMVFIEDISSTAERVDQQCQFNLKQSLQK